jgi:hypothetical protein
MALVTSNNTLRLYKDQPLNHHHEFARKISTLTVQCTARISLENYDESIGVDRCHVVDDRHALQRVGAVAPSRPFGPTSRNRWSEDRRQSSRQGGRQDCNSACGCACTEACTNARADGCTDACARADTSDCACADS